MKTPYYEKLQNPKWQKKRLEIMERDGFACVDCDEKEKQLQVHHNIYIAGREPWQHPEWTLSTLCDKCHKRRHLSLDDTDTISPVEFFLLRMQRFTGGRPSKIREIEISLTELYDNPK